jgi:hypothetical protein
MSYDQNGTERYKSCLSPNLMELIDFHHRNLQNTINRKKKKKHKILD